MNTSSFQPARLIPITGIKGYREQERRATRALMAVMQAVPDFARALLEPLGAPAGKISTFIEPELTQADKKVHPDGLIAVERAGVEDRIKHRGIKSPQDLIRGCSPLLMRPSMTMEKYSWRSRKSNKNGVAK